MPIRQSVQVHLCSHKDLQRKVLARHTIEALLARRTISLCENEMLWPQALHAPERHQRAWQTNYI